MSTGATTTGRHDYLARVAAIADVVRGDAEQAEIDRRLGDKTVDALRESGLLRMLLPPRYGGGGLHLADTFPIVEAMSRVNGSAGWNLQIGATTVSIAHDLADESARDEVLGDERTIVAGTINFMNIKARRADGGYVFDGDATFLSGSAHADWLMVGGWLHDDTGKPQFAKSRMPHVVRGVVPIDAIGLRDTWRVSGMRATSSNDGTLDSMFVADRYMCAAPGTGLAADDPAASLPVFSRFGGGLSYVGIGIARGALDALNHVAATKVPVGGSGPLAERPDVQIDVARARGMIEAGAAFLREAWAAAEAKLVAGQTLDLDDQAMLRLSYVTAAEYAAHATDIIARTAGSSGLYERDGIERCWRDANAVTKHVTVSARFYDRVGRILLGLPPLPGPI
jgi:alkylation response protein AidB-like acyl-CoA dehydrogenase